MLSSGLAGVVPHLAARSSRCFRSSALSICISGGASGTAGITMPSAAFSAAETEACSPNLAARSSRLARSSSECWGAASATPPNLAALASRLAWVGVG